MSEAVAVVLALLAVLVVGADDLMAERFPVASEQSFGGECVVVDVCGDGGNTDHGYIS